MAVQDHRLFTIFFDENKFDDSKFAELLFALKHGAYTAGPPYTFDTTGVVSLVRRSGHDITASEVGEFFDALLAVGVQRPNFEDFFRTLRKARHNSAPAKEATWGEALWGLFVGASPISFPIVLIFSLFAISSFWKLASTLQFAVLLAFTGRSLAVTLALALPIWGFGRMSASGGGNIDRSHEWRLVTKDGRPGARVRDATARDLYEHTHGYGSWDKHARGTKRACFVLCVLLFLVCPLFWLSYLRESGADFIKIAVYYAIYPLAPVVLFLLGYLLILYLDKKYSYH